MLSGGLSSRKGAAIMSVSIFVSHRTDLRAVTVNNEIYRNMLCGAAYYSGERYIEGDDTQDNISEKKPNLSELTVQYWAWKNCTSDYIGLCHYRRFLSFNESKHFRCNRRNYVDELFLNDKTMKRYGLNDPEHIAAVTEGYDAITNIPFDVRGVITPMGYVNNVYELWYAHTIQFIDKRALEILADIVRDVEPEYSPALEEYFEGTQQRGYNCFVLKRELFCEMCRFQFSVIDELNRRISPDSYEERFMRTPGYIAEILYGVFSLHIVKKGYKMKELQLVFFAHAEVPEKTVRGFCRRRGYQIVELGNAILPIGTKRREFVKKIYFGLFPQKRRN